MQRKPIYRIDIKSILSFLIVALFAVQIATRATYTHSHQLADGRVICHAHPYDKASDSKPFKSHHHTQTEILFLEQLANLFVAVFLTVSLILVLREASYKKHFCNIVVPSCVIALNDRAPPVLL